MKHLISIIMLYNIFFVSNVNAAPVLVSNGLDNLSYSASSTYLSNFAGNPFNSNGVWNAGRFSGWIEVNLGQVYSITSLELLVNQSPNGVTTHEIWFSNSPIQNDHTSATLFNSLTRFTTNTELITQTLASPFSAQFVQINTTLSPSWVSWASIKVTAEVSTVPELPVLWLLGSSFVGLIGARKKSAKLSRKYT
jgi:hypothetical protein